jgi:small subunit ribosomal protein S4
MRENAKKQVRVQDALKPRRDRTDMPGWVSGGQDAKMEGIFKEAPDRDDIGADINGER